MKNVLTVLGIIIMCIGAIVFIGLAGSHKLFIPLLVFAVGGILTAVGKSIK